MDEQKRIPCPECANRKRLNIDNERWRPCEKCGSVRDGTIPDRRSPTANDRAVEALRAWAIRYMQEYDGTDDARMRDAADVVLDIIREEAKRG